jgi:cytochrome c biogenesis protein CcmG/thiol:disulfide interchange protein DsbE
MGNEKMKNQQWSIWRRQRSAFRTLRLFIQKRLLTGVLPKRIFARSTQKRYGKHRRPSQCQLSPQPNRPLPMRLFRHPDLCEIVFESAGSRHQRRKWLTTVPDMQGKFVLIDFWATRCGPCRCSIPHLNELSAKFKDKLVVIGISNEPEQAIRAMSNPKIDYTIASDTQGRTKKDVQVTGIPHAMLIDPHGMVRFEGMPHYLEEKSLEKLMAKYAQ